MTKGLFLGWSTLVGIVTSIILTLPEKKDSFLPDGKRHGELAGATVLIEAGDNHGSGFVVQRGSQQFIWTVAHILEPLEKMQAVLDPGSGHPRLQVSYERAKVIRMRQKKGIPSGERFVYAEILRYSDQHQGEDIALLVASDRITPSSTTLTLEPPVPGTPVTHVGSPFGRQGYNSVIPGYTTALGRCDAAPDGRLRLYDQYALPITSGCSGGPVFDLVSGRVLGIASHVNKQNHSIAYFIPSRVLHDFARRHDCLWALDCSVPLPSPQAWKQRSPRVTPVPVVIKEKSGDSPARD